MKATKELVKNEMLKSRTIRMSLILDLLITVQMTMPELRDLLGVWFGLALLGVNLAVKYYKIMSPVNGTDK